MIQGAIITGSSWKSARHAQESAWNAVYHFMFNEEIIFDLERSEEYGEKRWFQRYDHHILLVVAEDEDGVEG